MKIFRDDRTRTFRVTTKKYTSAYLVTMTRTSEKGTRYAVTVTPQFLLDEIGDPDTGESFGYSFYYNTATEDIVWRGDAIKALVECLNAEAGEHRFTVADFK